MLGSGQYTLCEEYRHFAVTPSHWFTAFTDKQKEDARKKFQCCSVDDMQPTGSTSSTLAVFMKEGSSKTEDLSVSIQSAVEITGLPTLVIRQMWAKAIDLVSTTGHVLPAPGSCSMSRMVASLSHKRPHFVSCSFDGRFECDNDCQGFTQRYICAHCVATAGDNEMLKEFIENYAKFSKTPKGSKSVALNFTRLAMSDLPRGKAEQKGGKAPKKKAVNRRRTIASEYRQPLQPSSEPVVPLVSFNSFVGPSAVTVVTFSSNGNFNWMNSPFSFSPHSFSLPYQSQYPNPSPLYYPGYTDYYGTQTAYFADAYEPYKVPSSSYQYNLHITVLVEITLNPVKDYFWLSFSMGGSRCVLVAEALISKESIMKCSPHHMIFVLYILSLSHLQIHTLDWSQVKLEMLTIM